MLNFIFSNCWMYFPANAIVAGSAAGVYFVQMSSTSVGTIFNNVLSSGAPSIPASPTAFSTTGPGAYTQTTSAVTLVTIPVLGGSMGVNGALYVRDLWITPSNANSKQTQVTFGGSAAVTYSPASQQTLGVERMIRNAGVTNSQIVIAASTSLSSDVGASGSAPSSLSINTANNQNLVHTVLIGTATDYAIMASGLVELLAAA